MPEGRATERPSPADTRALVRVAAAVASRDHSAVQEALDAVAAIGSGGTAPRSRMIEAVDEVLLQSVLFVGYPAALDALAAWRERVRDPAPLPTHESPELWADRGVRICQAVYGDQYEPLRANIRALHPDAEEWMLTDGYGRVLGRPALDLATRELAIVAQLAVQIARRQLYSHARGALRVGASLADVEDALASARPWIAPERWPDVEAVWTTVQSRFSIHQD